MGKELVECPECTTKFETSISSSINITKEPFRIKQILSGKVNISKCPSCHTIVQPRAHILISKMEPEPEWIWLVSKNHKSPIYKEKLLKTLMGDQVNLKKIKQKMVYVEFGKPCSSLKFLLSDQKPETKEEWVELGKLYSGKDAIECYRNALKLNQNYAEAKKLMHKELDTIKTYS